MSLVDDALHQALKPVLEAISEPVRQVKKVPELAKQLGTCTDLLMESADSMHAAGDSIANLVDQLKVLRRILED